VKVERDGDLDTRNEDGVDCTKAKEIPLGGTEEVRDVEEIGTGLTGNPLKGSVSDEFDKMEREKTEDLKDETRSEVDGEFVEVERGNNGGGALSAVIRLQIP